MNPAVFFSYAHTDDDAEEGRLSEIRIRLERELTLLSGQPWQVFQDTEDIEVGQHWVRRLEQGLAGSTFFVPILTPTYFQRPICREELARFLDREKELGRDDLVIPIFYLNTPLLMKPPLSDALAETLSLRQYDDWRDLRRYSLDTAKLKRRITRLAETILNSHRSFPRRRAPSQPDVRSSSSKSSVSFDIGLDFGTANLRIFLANNGIVLREPSIAAVERGTSRMLSVGMMAMHARRDTNHAVIRPVRGGVIADDEVARSMLECYFELVSKTCNATGSLRVVVAVPAGSTEVEKRVFKEVCASAGAQEIRVMSQPIAAAIGMDLSIYREEGQIVLYLGAGVSEVAIIRFGEIVVGRSKRVAGDDMDDAIVQYIRRVHGLLIGEQKAERIKRRIGSAYPLSQETTMQVTGRDLTMGLPKTITITSQEIREALLEPIAVIVDMVRVTLEHCPPELSEDMVRNGIMMAGEGALLPGFDTLLTADTGVSAHVLEVSPEAVAVGVGRAVEELASPTSVGPTIWH